MAILSHGAETQRQMKVDIGRQMVPMVGCLEATEEKPIEDRKNDENIRENSVIRTLEDKGTCNRVL